MGRIMQILSKKNNFTNLCTLYLCTSLFHWKLHFKEGSLLKLVNFFNLLCIKILFYTPNNFL